MSSCLLRALCKRGNKKNNPTHLFLPGLDLVEKRPPRLPPWSSPVPGSELATFIVWHSCFVSVSCLSFSLTPSAFCLSARAISASTIRRTDAQLVHLRGRDSGFTWSCNCHYVITVTRLLIGYHQFSVTHSRNEPLKYQMNPYQKWYFFAPKLLTKNT